MLIILEESLYGDNIWEHFKKYFSISFYDNASKFGVNEDLYILSRKEIIENGELIKLKFSSNTNIPILNKYHSHISDDAVTLCYYRKNSSIYGKVVCVGIDPYPDIRNIIISLKRIDNSLDETYIEKMLLDYLWSGKKEKFLRIFYEYINTLFNNLLKKKDEPIKKSIEKDLRNLMRKEWRWSNMSLGDDQDRIHRLEYCKFIEGIFNIVNKMGNYII